MAEHDKPHATVIMVDPRGKKSSIRVHLTDVGCDVIFARSSQGELMVRLPAYAAKQLGEALSTASALVARPGERGE